jgi:hypothetical protein
LEHATVAHLGELRIFSWINIKQVIIPLLLGAAIFVYGARRELFGLKRARFDLFHLRLPAWLGVDYWYQAGARGFLATLWAGAGVNARAKGYALGLIRGGVDGLRRIPRGPVRAVKIEALYTFLARSSRTALEGGRDSYARLREGGAARARTAPARMGRALREALPRDFARLGQDISLGPLMVTCVLLILLIVKLA